MAAAPAGRDPQPLSPCGGLIHPTLGLEALEGGGEKPILGSHCGRGVGEEWVVDSSCAYT